MRATIIRWFLSSTIADFKLERCALTAASPVIDCYTRVMKRGPLSVLLLGFGLGLAMMPRQGVAQELPARAERLDEAQAIDAIVHRLTQRPRALNEGPGNVLGTRQQGDGPLDPLTEQEIVDTLRVSHLTAIHSAALWAFFADQDNAPMATLSIVKALAGASDTPKAREAVWSELSGLVRAFTRENRSHMRERSLLGLFERHRDVLLPLLAELHETESSCDEMIELMLKSRVFGADIDESVAFVSERVPAAVARHIERERERGRTASWEYAAFESMVRWKDARLVPGAAKGPRSLAELDAAGKSFVTMFNCLHAVDEGFREVILRGLGPVELFNAVVAGEKELYGLGTSGYRGFLHAIIMQGIMESGSFEAFLERAVPRRLGDEAERASGHRGMVFLRVASSFGFLEPVLKTVSNRERFIGDAIASLGDPRSFEGNSAVVMDVLTARSGSSEALSFKRALLDQLYERYRSDGSAALRSVYGSMLSVYQTVTGDRRDSAIDRDFALDEVVFRIPFERLFSPDGKGGLTHRMFMRMDDNEDAVGTYEAFRALMESLGASERDKRHFDVFSFTAPGRTIEIYANKPNVSGMRQGIADIADALRGRRVETIIGRGHTSIIAPLQADAKRVLGDRIKEVASVIVGSCGGDVAVRELIATFGYIPFFTTKSTGRQLINNAIIENYITSLISLSPGDWLSVTDVLNRAIARFMRAGIDDALRIDASLYQVNMTTVLTALLFDAHVRSLMETDRHAARD